MDRNRNVQDLLMVLHKRRQHSFWKSTYLCLNVGDALQLADEIANIGWVIDGLVQWKVVNENDLVEQYQYQYWVDDEITLGENASIESSRMIKSFIETRIDPETSYVSFEFLLSKDQIKNWPILIDNWRKDNNWT